MEFRLKLASHFQDKYKFVVLPRLHFDVVSKNRWHFLLRCLKCERLIASKFLIWEIFEVIFFCEREFSIPQAFKNF